MEDVTPPSCNPTCLLLAALAPLNPLLPGGDQRRRRTDLVDDGEDGVDEHQVALLQRQVAGLLQGKQHRSDQGDLRGTSQ